MNDYTKVIDVNEVCKRFKLFRQNLEGTQMKMAEELSTEYV